MKPTCDRHLLDSKSYHNRNTSFAPLPTLLIACNCCRTVFGCSCLPVRLSFFFMYKTKVLKYLNEMSDGDCCVPMKAELQVLLRFPSNKVSTDQCLGRWTLITFPSIFGAVLTQLEGLVGCERWSEISYLLRRHCRIFKKMGSLGESVFFPHPCMDAIFPCSPLNSIIQKLLCDQLSFVKRAIPTDSST